MFSIHLKTQRTTKKSSYQSQTSIATLLNNNIFVQKLKLQKTID